jgi:hypothetical protein
LILNISSCSSGNGIAIFSVVGKRDGVNYCTINRSHPAHFMLSRQIRFLPDVVKKTKGLGDQTAAEAKRENTD